MKLKLGILGAGRIGRIHIDNALLNPSIALNALCDPMLDRAWAESRRLKVCMDENEFWECDFDAVIIASPSHYHNEQVKKAIHHKKHIFCEKPLTRTLAEHHEINDLLKNYAQVFQIGFNRRFDPDFSSIACRVRNNAVGRPYSLKITSRDPGLPPLDYLRHSGGMFFDMSIHDFDMARFVMGAEVIELFARGAALVDDKVLELGDNDTAIITLKFANGAFGSIDNSRQAVYGYDQRVEIFGSSASLQNQNHRQTKVELSNAQGMHLENAMHFFLERYEQSYRLELDAFIRRCQGQDIQVPSINDSLQALKMAHAAELSLKENRPVRLEEIA